MSSVLIPSPNTAIELTFHTTFIYFQRMGKAFDEFRSELEERETQQKREIQNLNENFRKEVTELTEATKTLIKQKEKFDPLHSERRQKFFDFLEQCTANIFNSHDMDAKLDTTAVPSASTATTTSPSIATGTTTVCTHKLSKSKRRQMLAAAKKQRGKGTKVTVTRVVEEANGVRRQMIITKHKSTTISISGVFERRKSTEDDDGKTDDDINTAADTDEEDVVNGSGAIKKDTKAGKFFVVIG